MSPGSTLIRWKMTAVPATLTLVLATVPWPSPVAGAASEPGGGAVPAPGSPSESLETKVDRLLEPYLGTGNFSGSILVGRDGKVLLAKGWGLANVEHRVPNTPETVFHLASVSRVFTSTAILLLEQDGRLELSDSIGKHLPGFPRGDTITADHLLTLSAGFPNINSLPGYDTWSLSPQTPADLVGYFRDLPLEFTPGVRSEHSNSNYNVLALLIERLSGMSFGEYLDHAIFEPLGMTQTGHDGDPSRIVPGRADGYAPAGVGGVVNAPFLQWSVKTGNGSLYSTVGDLYRFDRALSRPGFLSPENLKRTFTEHFEANGYGWFLRPRFQDREIYINGRSPGFGSYLGRLRDNDLTVIVLGNLYNSMPTDIARATMAIVLGKDYEPPEFRAEAVAAELLRDVVGEYQFGDDFYSPGRRYTMAAVSGHLLADGDWLMPTDHPLRFIHRIYGSELEFVRSAEGRVVACLWDGRRGERVAD